jgi:RNA polymerase sigma-70 factor (ECF subfamily)
MNPDWHSFVKSDGPKIFRYFLARFDPPTADDLVQEVLIRVIQKFRLGSFDPDRGNLTALSFGIAHNVAREKYRHAKRSLEDTQGLDRTKFELPSEAPLSDEELSQRQEMTRLKEAITHLPPAEQEVISLLVSLDIPLSELASILNLPLNTVKSHIHRAKAKLRDLLASRTAVKRGFS